jgi:hypothetical protein
MEILEVAIGLFFGYLVLSFVVTAAMKCWRPGSDVVRGCCGKESRSF